ncbi:hypothetical protein O3P69_004678 [Scylla paramamosain]|uniref:Transposase Helix-turn-helix domain-containing protein n=1 Tax=Scylla paramamosain TaxID=85552 RepID=A0AAW0UD33_SCYPA
MLVSAQGWSEAEKALQLATALRGPDVEVLGHLPPAQRNCYGSEAEALRRRFGHHHHAEVYRARLKKRTRERGDTLSQLAQDVEGLRYHGPGRYYWGHGGEGEDVSPNSSDEDVAGAARDGNEREAGSAASNSGDLDPELGARDAPLGGAADSPQPTPPPPQRPRRQRRRPGNTRQSRKGQADVLNNMSEMEFFRHLRLTRKSFDDILDLIHKAYGEEPSGTSLYLGPRKSLYLTLWYLGTQSTYREISEMFGVSQSVSRG